MLFALISGAWADRVDRRRLVVTVNIARALVIGLLAASIAAGFVSVPLIYLVFFVLGTGETLADTASAAFVPAIVPQDRLPVANSLLGGTFTVAVANLAFCAAFAIFVLYARSVLGLSSVGYGLLLTAFAVGGLLGNIVPVRPLRPCHQRLRPHRRHGHRGGHLAGRLPGPVLRSDHDLLDSRSRHDRHSDNRLASPVRSIPSLPPNPLRWLTRASGAWIAE